MDDATAPPAEPPIGYLLGYSSGQIEALTEIIGRMMFWTKHTPDEADRAAEFSVQGLERELVVDQAELEADRVDLDDPNAVIEALERRAHLDGRQQIASRLREILDAQPPARR